MRAKFWRRVVAALALVIGLGVAAPAAQASPVSTNDVSSTTVTTAVPQSHTTSDWWW